MENFGPFKLYTKVPNDIHYGKLYTTEVEMPILFSKKRTIRVYLPEDFDEHKKYPLLIMADGQNIVDKYTTAFGAWYIDVHQHNLIKDGHRSFIVLGIDSAHDPIHRAIEYSFPFIKIENKEVPGYDFDNFAFESHLFYKYVALELLPFVKQYFPISDKKEDIGVGGSSMGGVFATSLITSYPNIFGFALIFSPGYFLYSEMSVNKYFDETLSKLNDHKLFFYSGEVGFEEKFPKRTKSAYEYFISKGFKKANACLLIDPTGTHNEETWSKHFEEAIKFCLK